MGAGHAKPRGLATADQLAAPNLPVASDGGSLASSAEKTRRWAVAFRVTVTGAGFGVSMFLNSIASRLLPVPPVASAMRCRALVGDAPLGTWMLAAMAGPVFTLAAGRALALLLIVGVLLFLEPRTMPVSALRGLGAGPDADPAGAASVTAGAAAAAAANTVADAAAPATVGRWSWRRMSADRRLRHCWLYGPPVFIGVANCVAYSAYMALTTLADVSIWSALMACYIVFPVGYGILLKGESRGWRKLLGVAACIAAATLLGLGSVFESADGDTGASDGVPDISAPLWVKLVLFLSAMIFWALGDGVSSYILSAQRPPKGGQVATLIVDPSNAAAVATVGDWRAAESGASTAHLPSNSASLAVATGTIINTTDVLQHRPPPPLSMVAITALTAVGFCVFAAAAGGLEMVLGSSIALPVGPAWPAAVQACFAAQVAEAAAVSGSATYPGMLLLLFVGQCLGMIAWFSMVQLGRLSDASAFLPLIALDVFIPVILGIVLLQETVSAPAYAGMALAAVGLALVSTAV